MDKHVRQSIGAFPGKVSLFAKNLDTGDTYGIGPDDRVRTASTIKLPMMTAIFAAVAEGKAKWSEELVLRDSEKVSGSGVLHLFSGGVRLPIRDLVHLMIDVSDNTATNLLLDRFSADSVNEMMDKLGLKQTRALRKILRGDKAGGVSAAGKLEQNQKFGLGVSTPRDMVLLLEKLDRGQVVSADASHEMIAILKRQQYRDGIARKLGDDMQVANKTGALDHLRSDVGIVYSPRGRIAVAITCEDIPKGDYSEDNPGLLLIAEIARALVDGL